MAEKCQQFEESKETIDLNQDLNPKPSWSGNRWCQHSYHLMVWCSSPFIFVICLPGIEKSMQGKAFYIRSQIIQVPFSIGQLDKAVATITKQALDFWWQESNTSKIGLDWFIQICHCSDDTLPQSWHSNRQVQIKSKFNTTLSISSGVTTRGCLRQHKAWLALSLAQSLLGMYGWEVMWMGLGFSAAALIASIHSWLRFRDSFMTSGSDSGRILSISSLVGETVFISTHPTPPDAPRIPRLRSHVMALDELIVHPLFSLSSTSSRHQG